MSELPVIGRFFPSPGDTPNPEDVTTITVWGLWEDPAVMATLVGKFEEQNPDIKVKYEDRTIMSPGDYKERVLAR